MHDNKAQNRFELTIGGHLTYADYRLIDTTLFIDYVFAPPALRGTGAAGTLMQAISDHAKAEKLGITPICGYAASWLARHD